MAKDISKFIIRLDDEQGWENIMEISNRKLVVLDCHQEWCGNVEAILPSMTRVMIEYDSAEERFQYASAPISKLGAKIQPSLPSDCKVDLEKNGCLPFFALYRVSTLFHRLRKFD